MEKIKLYLADGEVMKFEWSIDSGLYDPLDSNYDEYAISQFFPPELLKWDGKRHQTVEWSILNPTHLEIIKEKECPECKGKGRKLTKGIKLNDDFSYSGASKCSKCTDGKIEEVTFTGFFGDMAEHDNKIWEECRGIIRDEFEKYKGALKEGE